MGQSINGQRFSFVVLLIICNVLNILIPLIHGCPGHTHQGNNHGNSSEDEVPLIPPEDFERQVEDMNEFLKSQMEEPGAEDNTDLSTKVNSSSYGFPDMGIFRQVFAGSEEAVKRDSVCAACQVYIGVLMYQINRQNTSRQNLELFAIFTCRFFRMAHPDVCDGLVKRLGPTFYWIVHKRKSDLSPQEFCGVTLQSFGCRISKAHYHNSEFDWELDPKQLVPPPPVGINGAYEPADPTDNVETFTPLSTKRGQRGRIIKILHLADLHIDLDYAPGTLTDCENEILCCQKQFGYPNETQTPAGYYGDNGKCDAPMKMLHLALKHIRKEHSDIDLIYMTGDLVPHNIWYTDRDDNEYIIKRVSRVIFDYFPNTRLIPCLGNHEAHPVNLFSPTNLYFASQNEANPIPRDLRQDWVYESAYEAWKQWIPSSERENFLQAGNFVVEINSKFRAIVVNTNLCYGFNMWQTYAPQDPGNMLKWLQNELYQTEALGKTAHIVGHVPPGHEDCSKTWSREFYKLVSRYRNVITGQFYGHTHYDEFRILHDPDNKHIPMNMMWIAPSLTPYRIYNPSYRIYHMDSNERTYSNIIDHETWIFDLDKANEQYRQLYGPNGTTPTSSQEDIKFANWYKYYQATEAYDIPDLLPNNMRKLVSKMASENSTFETFYQYYYKATNKKFEEEYPCDTLCKKRILCGIVRPYYDDDGGHVECNNVQREVDGVALPLRALNRRRRFIWL